MHEINAWLLLIHRHWFYSPRWALALALALASSSKCRQRPLCWTSASEILQPSCFVSSWTLSIPIDFGRPRPRWPPGFVHNIFLGRLRLQCDGTRAETRFRVSTKRTSPFKSAGASVQSTTGRRAVHISLQGFYCSCKPVFCSHVTLTGYPLHSLASPSLLLPCVTVCHHISNVV
jgi:hypothetical protein